MCTYTAKIGLEMLLTTGMVKRWRCRWWGLVSLRQLTGEGSAAGWPPQTAQDFFGRITHLRSLRGRVGFDNAIHGTTFFRRLLIINSDSVGFVGYSGWELFSLQLWKKKRKKSWWLASWIYHWIRTRKYNGKGVVVSDSRNELFPTYICLLQHQGFW